MGPMCAWLTEQRMARASVSYASARNCSTVRIKSRCVSGWRCSSTTELRAFGEELHDLRGKFFADAFNGGDLFGAGATQAGDAAELLEQQILSALRNAGAVVEDALGDPALHQELMISVGEAVRF